MSLSREDFEDDIDWLVYDGVGKMLEFEVQDRRRLHRMWEEERAVEMRREKYDYPKYPEDLKEHRDPL